MYMLSKGQESPLGIEMITIIGAAGLWICSLQYRNIVVGCSLINLLHSDLWALLHTRDHHLLLLLFLLGLFGLDLPLMLIEVIFLASK